MIEDKRKFDIMEFVSCKGKVGRSLLLENRREEGNTEGSFLSPAPSLPTLTPGAAFGGSPGYTFPAGP